MYVYYLVKSAIKGYKAHLGQADISKLVKLITTLNKH